MTNKQLAIGLVVVAIVAITGLFFPTVPARLSGQILDTFTGDYFNVTTANGGGAFRINGTTVLDSNGLTLNTNSTRIAGIVAGSCTIWAANNTIAASTTAQVVCQSATNGTLASLGAGVTTDAICNLNHASSTNTTSNGIVVAGVSASSTAGTIVAQLSNLTGTTFTWTAAASSSSQWTYNCFDPN